jgi:hypothetical protein
MFRKLDLFPFSGKREDTYRHLSNNSCTDMGCPMIKVSFFLRDPKEDHDKLKLNTIYGTPKHCSL